MYHVSFVMYVSYVIYHVEYHVSMYVNEISWQLATSQKSHSHSIRDSEKIFFHYKCEACEALRNDA